MILILGNNFWSLYMTLWHFYGCVFVSRGGDRIDQCLQVFVNMLAASPTHSSEITTKFVFGFFSPIELRQGVNRFVNRSKTFCLTVVKATNARDGFCCVSNRPVLRCVRSEHWLGARQTSPNRQVHCSGWEQNKLQCQFAYAGMNSQEIVQNKGYCELVLGCLSAVNRTGTLSAAIAKRITNCIYF